jgi:hypothetical protein
MTLQFSSTNSFDSGTPFRRSHVNISRRGSLGSGGSHTGSVEVIAFGIVSRAGVVTLHYRIENTVESKINRFGLPQVDPDGPGSVFAFRRVPVHNRQAGGAKQDWLPGFGSEGYPLAMSSVSFEWPL